MQEFDHVAGDVDCKHNCSWRITVCISDDFYCVPYNSIALHDVKTYIIYNMYVVKIVLSWKFFFCDTYHWHCFLSHTCGWIAGHGQLMNKFKSK